MLFVSNAAYANEVTLTYMMLLWT